MAPDDERDRQATRREVLRAAGALALGGAAASVAVAPAAATPAEMQAAVAGVVGDARVNVGRVEVDIPPLVENGNTVPCTVTVESPMTAADHVKAIHVFAERNPQPYVVSVALGPRAGRARVSTRIRLRDTQNVHVVAEMSDGTFWSGRANVIVTIGACLEDVL
jgi:sulfur-oxidizing protein SoxY